MKTKDENKTKKMKIEMKQISQNNPLMRLILGNFPCTVSRQL